MLEPAFWWMIVGVGLMLLELLVPGLVLFFFGLGALATALLAWLIPMPPAAQLALFVVASLVALAALRRFLKPVFTGRSNKGAGTLSDALAGQEARVVSAISPDAAGRVELNGTGWKAESVEVLEAGRTVVIVGQKSLTLVVEGK